MTNFDEMRTLLEAARTAIATVEQRINTMEIEATASDRERFIAQPSTTATSANAVPGDSTGGRISPSRTTNESANEIIGGDLVGDGQYPDCCAVGRATGWIGTGTLIAPNLVVTARHCTNLSQVFFGNSLRNFTAGMVVKVKQQFSYPTDGLNIDISVLLLETDAPITPRHIAQGNEVRPRNNETVLVGFGVTDMTGIQTYGDKRKAVVPIVSLDCADLSDASRYHTRAGYEMVAGQRGLNRDTCQGDSGGPAYIVTPEGDTYLLGITSRGVPGVNTRCGDGGIYIRADKFIDWIAQTTGVRVEGSRS